MNIIQLAEQRGLRPFYASGTEGGEYKSACPACGGTDRFYMQPKKQMKHCTGYYRCRQCGAAGDAIEFARQFLGMSFQEAADAVEAVLPAQDRRLPIPKKSKPAAKMIGAANVLWQEKACSFVAWAHSNLMKNQPVLCCLASRGIDRSMVKRYKIGWCPEDIYKDRRSWAIANSEKKLWLPKGIVIPIFDQRGQVIRLKVRRPDSNAADPLGKYIVIPGGLNGLSIIGDRSKSLMIIVESELDGYLIHNVMYDYAFVVVVGGSAKLPDNIVDLLAKRSDILLCHDNDDAGLHMLRSWQKRYSHAIAYPTPYGKDIGEAVAQGLRIRSWLLSYKWNDHPERQLINKVLCYIDARQASRSVYAREEQDIFKGPEGTSRARQGMLQKDLRHMLSMVYDEGVSI